MISAVRPPLPVVDEEVAVLRILVRAVREILQRLRESFKKGDPPGPPPAGRTIKVRQFQSLLRTGKLLPPARGVLPVGSRVVAARKRESEVVIMGRLRAG